MLWFVTAQPCINPSFMKSIFPLIHSPLISRLAHDSILLGWQKLGYTGQSLVPLPPERITGIIDINSHILFFNLAE